MEGEVKISDFSFSCRETECNTFTRNNDVNTRWAAPEVLKTSIVSKYSDVWYVNCSCVRSQYCVYEVLYCTRQLPTIPLICSHRSYGVLLYEFVTGGSVPYANFNNTEVRNKVRYNIGV